MSEDEMDNYFRSNAIRRGMVGLDRSKTVDH